MEPNALNLETWQIIAGALGLLLIVVLAAWAIIGARRGRTTGLTLEQRHQAALREKEGLSEQYTLLAERLDRAERTNQELREETVALRESLNARTPGTDGLDRTVKELQDQIFELREEHKVLMQRDDRHERAMQELQAEFNNVRKAVH